MTSLTYGRCQPISERKASAVQNVDLLSVIAVVVVIMLIKFALDALRSSARRTWAMAQTMFATLGVVVMGFAALALLAGTLVARLHG